MAEKAYIVEAVRTAGGKRDGRLSLWHPADLGAKVLDELVTRLDMDPALVDDVVFGCVDQVGAQSGNVARNAIGIPNATQIAVLRLKNRKSTAKTIQRPLNPFLTSKEILT